MGCTRPCTQPCLDIMHGSCSGVVLGLVLAFLGGPKKGGGGSGIGDAVYDDGQEDETPEGPDQSVHKLR